MNEKRAREILKEYIQPNNSLNHLLYDIAWVPGWNEVQINGGLTLNELEAIAWWMRYNNAKQKAIITRPNI